MNCDRCKDVIPQGEAEDFCGQTLCEDCFMDAFAPVRTCDPWAVRSASRFVEPGGSTAPTLTVRQGGILAIISETSGVSMRTLAERLEAKEADVQREIATLRHMEKIRGAMQDGQKVFRLW
jgi:hypothetical protein